MESILNQRMTELELIEWIKLEMPAGTVIGNPGWWASRIAYRARTMTAPRVPEGYVLVPLRPDQPRIDAGAQHLVSWDAGCTWPDSWDPMHVAAARQDAGRVYLEMVNYAGEQAAKSDTASGAVVMVDPDSLADLLAGKRDNAPIYRPKENWKAGVPLFDHPTESVAPRVPEALDADKLHAEKEALDPPVKTPYMHTLRWVQGWNACREAMLTVTPTPVVAAPIPFAYACPAKCGCLWRDNHNGTMSLFGEKSQSCNVCDPMSLSELTPLYLSSMAQGAEKRGKQ